MTTCKTCRFWSHIERAMPGGKGYCMNHGNPDAPTKMSEYGTMWREYVDESFSCSRHALPHHRKPGLYWVRQAEEGEFSDWVPAYWQEFNGYYSWTFIGSDCSEPEDYVAEVDERPMVRPEP